MSAKSGEPLSSVAQELLQLDEKYSVGGFVPTPGFLVSGKGSTLILYNLGICNMELNIRNWRHVLDDRAGGDDVGIYEAPGRAIDLSGLPLAYLDVGAAEPFGDEDVNYAMRPCEGGVDVELHVWPGTAQGREMLVGAEIPKLAATTQLQWMRRRLLPNRPLKS